MNPQPTLILLFFACLISRPATGQEGASGARSQEPRPPETTEQRLDRLDRENRELRTRVEGLEHGTSRPANLPPGIRKAAAVDEGVSIAGYGEYLFTQQSGRTDQLDALRAVLYFGYNFDRNWRFHSELEVEHAITEATSGTTDEGGEVALEFSYLEYQATVDLALRAGLILVPVGLTNEQHEPTMFLAAARPETERRIIPTTWSEIGLEGVTMLGDFEFKAFAGSTFDGERFDESGLRDGRQEGNRAAADTFGGALRADWRGIDGLLLGGSAYYGQAGQDGLQGTTPIPELDTGILEAHADWRHGPWSVRTLYATALVDDAGEFDRATGAGLARRMHGGYVELGCDVLTFLAAGSGAALVPFVRYEHIDTQAEMPGGIAGDPRQNDQILTLGLDLRPIDRVVIKADFENWDHDFDRFNLSVGYVF